MICSFVILKGARIYACSSGVGAKSSAVPPPEGAPPPDEWAFAGIFTVASSMDLIELLRALTAWSSEFQILLRITRGLNTITQIRDGKLALLGVFNCFSKLDSRLTGFFFLDALKVPMRERAIIIVFISACARSYAKCFSSWAHLREHVQTICIPSLAGELSLFLFGSASWRAPFPIPDLSVVQELSWL